MALKVDGKFGRERESVELAPNGPTRDGLRVLHAVSGLRTGGAERMLARVIEGLAGDHDQAVVAMVDGPIRPRLEALGVPVVRPRMRGSAGGAEAALRAIRFARAFQPDIIQGWMYHGNLLADLVRRAACPSAHCVWNIRQSLDGIEAEKLSTRMAIRVGAIRSPRVDGMLYNSEQGARQHAGIGFRARRSRVIPNGFSPDEFERASGAEQRLRDGLGIPGDSPIVACVARYHPMKDHANVLAAATRLRASVPATHFVLLGTGTDRQDTDLARSIEAEGLTDRVHRLGEIPDPREIVSGVDLVVLGSAWGEGFPNALGEALALGVPCVATDVGDCRLVIGPGGIIVPPRDSAALAEAIRRLLTMSSDARRAIGTAGREHVRSRFAIEEVVEQYEEFYHSLR